MRMGMRMGCMGIQPVQPLCLSSCYWRMNDIGVIQLRTQIWRRRDAFCVCGSHLVSAVPICLTDPTINLQNLQRTWESAQVPTVSVGSHHPSHTQRRKTQKKDITSSIRLIHPLYSTNLFQSVKASIIAMLTNYVRRAVLRRPLMSVSSTTRSMSMQQMSDFVS